jgi:hypothetical protein
VTIRTLSEVIWVSRLGGIKRGNWTGGYCRTEEWAFPGVGDDPIG